MKKQIKKTFIGFVGGLVVIAGIIMIPYPGPGWLVIFAGLGILATEYPWAQNVLNYAKDKYDAWNRWIKRQNFFIQSVTWLLTALVVIATVWLLNGYGIINHLLNLGWNWLDSPLPIFHH